MHRNYTQALVTISIMLAMGYSFSAEDAAMNRGLRKTVFLVPALHSTVESDDLFLVTVPAASVACDGKPVICTVEPRSPWQPKLLNYLRQYKPHKIIWVGPTPAVAAPSDLKIDVLEEFTAMDAACKLAETFWTKSTEAIVYNTKDAAGALTAAVLAGRRRAPLFPWTSGPLPESALTCLGYLGVTKLLVVGAPAFKLPMTAGVQHLEDSSDVTEVLAKGQGNINYLAVLQPHDSSIESTPRNSLAAVLLAVGWNGAVLPRPFNARPRLMSPLKIAQPAVVDITFTRSAPQNLPAATLLACRSLTFQTMVASGLSAHIQQAVNDNYQQNSPPKGVDVSLTQRH